MTGTEPARKLLVVCYGNHCRSPLAAAALARSGGPAVTVRSAGIHDRWVGKPAHELMVQAADRQGFDLSGHRGAQITDADIDWADAILGMDGRNIGDLNRLVGPAHTSKISLLLGDTEIPDPWGQDPAGFAACADLIVTRTRWPR
ncbi:low molecular weight protein-tyrosine-phosphatase [Streptomyces sp. NPDC002690]